MPAGGEFPRALGSKSARRRTWGTRRPWLWLALSAAVVLVAVSGGGPPVLSGAGLGPTPGASSRGGDTSAASVASSAPRGSGATRDSRSSRDVRAPGDLGASTDTDTDTDGSPGGGSSSPSRLAASTGAVAPGRGLSSARQVRWSADLLPLSATALDESTGTWAGTNAVLGTDPSAGGGSGLTLLPLLPVLQPASASSGTPENGGLVPATPGMLYRGTASVETSGPTEFVQPVVLFYDSAGDVLATVGGQSSAVSETSVTLAPALAFAPPAATGAAFGVVVWSDALLGQQTVVQDPSLTDTVDAGSSPVDGPLHTSGNRIVQADGSPLVLHGVQLDGMESNPTVPAQAEQEIEEAKAWGANMVRVSLGEQFWLPSSCSYVPSYASAVDQVVQWITSLGMVALLDLHFNAILPCTPGAAQMMADYPGSTEFWSSVAARYAQNPLVAFDLYNEPNGVTDAVWLDGGEVMSGLIPFEAAGMQQLYDAVRATGAQNLVVVSGNSWANDLPAQLVSGTDIAYGVHDYSCSQNPPPDCTTADPDDAGTILDSWVGRSATVPVVITEFGWPSQDDGTFITNVIDFAQDQGWGWSAFAFDEVGPWGLLVAEPPGVPAEPSASGMPVLAALVGTG